MARSADGEIRIRPYAVGDAPLLFEAARESIAEVYPWLEWCHPDYRIEEAQEWIASQVESSAAGQEFAFVIESAAGAQLGGVGLNEIRPLHQVANLGYWVRSSAAGHGVASRAVGLAAAWAFAHTELVRLEIIAAVGNRASQRVAEKAGAHREGVLRQRLQLHGVWHDAVMSSIVRDA